MPNDEVIAWAAKQLFDLLPQIQEDIDRAVTLCTRPGGPLLKYKMGQVRHPEEVLVQNLACLRGSVKSIAEALNSNPKLEKGVKDEEG